MLTSILTTCSKNPKEIRHSVPNPSPPHQAQHNRKAINRLTNFVVIWWNSKFRDELAKQWTLAPVESCGDLAFPSLLVLFLTTSYMYIKYCNHSRPLISLPSLQNTTHHPHQSLSQIHGLGLILWLTRFNQGYQCGHGFGTMHRSLMGSPMEMYLKAMIPCPP